MHTQHYQPATGTPAPEPNPFAMDTVVFLYSKPLGDSPVLIKLPLAFLRVCPLLNQGLAFRISLDAETILVDSDGQGNVGGMNPWVSALEAFYGLYNAQLTPPSAQPEGIPDVPAAAAAVLEGVHGG